MVTTRAAFAAAQFSGTSENKRKFLFNEPPVRSKKHKRILKATDGRLVAPVASDSDPTAIASSSVRIPSGTATELPESFDCGMLPSVLTFSFEDAKQHLISVDHRFDDLFHKMVCRPFQHLENVHPFRALVTSILGQQISWIAARSINHRFRRLYDPSLPEKPAVDGPKTVTSSFPTPQDVANTDITTLKTAGLSTRKAEYVRELASRFADGRLSTKKITEANDEELAKMLIEVKGIGRWTGANSFFSFVKVYIVYAVDMFAIFSLRRPDILPVGDLGVQRGLVQWFLSLHSPAHRYSVSPEKIGRPSRDEMPKKLKHDPDPVPGSKDVLPTVQAPVKFVHRIGSPFESNISSVLPSDVLEDIGESDGIPVIPPPFTPSIRKTMMNKQGSEIIPLPDCLSISMLKSRLEGKNKIKGAFLTPKEMEDLTACWRPYRSIGVYYMWSLAEVTET